MAQATDAEAVPPHSEQSYPRRWLVLAVVGVAQFIVLLDSTIVNVALPSIQRDLNASTSSLQWVLNAYILLFGSLLLLGGRLSDILGRRRTFVFGLLVFTVASLVCGFADSSGVLVVARAVQGIGAAPLSAAALAILLSVFRDPKEQGVALTVWSGLGVLGGTLGVVLGGAMVNLWDWQWAFWINVPIGAIVLVFTFRLVPALRPAQDGSRPRLDVPGALLAISALFLLIYALIGAEEHGWASLRTLGILAASAVLFAVFAFVELRTTGALMPLRLLAVGRFGGSGIGLLLVSAVMITSFYMVSVYEQSVLGFDPLQAGLGMLGMGVASTAMAFAMPFFIKKIGLERTYLMGAAFLLIGCLLLTGLPAQGSYFAILLPGTSVIGLGLPACFVPLTSMGVAQVNEAESGIASGFLNTLIQIGSALGLATVVTLAAARTDSEIAAGHGSAEALAAGFGWGFVVLSGVAAASALIAVVFLAKSRRRSETGAMTR